MGKQDTVYKDNESGLEPLQIYRRHLVYVR